MIVGNTGPSRRRQSELLARPLDKGFQPGPSWTRLSFLDLVGEGPCTPPYRLEPAYLDHSTLVALWPSDDNHEAVLVATWAPDSDTLQRLHLLQLDWPPALCDLLVRQLTSGRIELQPCRTSLARTVSLATGECALRVRHALERGARALGRDLALAA